GVSRWQFWLLGTRFSMRRHLAVALMPSASSAAATTTATAMLILAGIGVFGYTLDVRLSRGLSLGGLLAGRRLLPVSSTSAAPAPAPVAALSVLRRLSRQGVASLGFGLLLLVFADLDLFVRLHLGRRRTDILGDCRRRLRWDLCP